MLTLAALAFAAALSPEADAVINRPLHVAPRVTAAQVQAQADEPVRLEDIQVTGRSLESLINGFVEGVAAPNRHRGLARWDSRVCVGAVNLAHEPAQYLVDRVSTVALDLGLETGAPGCTPNVIIVATADPDGLAQGLAETNRRAMRPGGAGMDRGGAAFERFQSSDSAVRWWQVSMPVDSETGNPATRIPGDCRQPCEGPADFAPIINVSHASRLTTQIVDEILRTVVILDIDKVSTVSAQQLADYIAMVTFAQIVPDADASDYASVLNVFEAPQSADGLTQWDIAYLEGLYQAQRTLRSSRAARREVATSIRRAHDRLNSAEQ